MQLRFTTDELKLLVAILQDNSSPKAEPLLDMVLARDMRFGFDELEDLGEIVSGYLHAGAPIEPARRAALEQIQDKITAACAMA